MLTNKNYNNLSEKEKYYFQKIEYYSSEIPSMSINTLAEKVYTSPASISRLVKKLGYDNFKDFKQSFVPQIKTDNDSTLRAHIDHIFNTFPCIIDSCLVPAIIEAKSIYIVCFGNSVGLGQELALTLSREGYIVFKIYDSDFIDQIEATIKNGDLVIYISYNGTDVDMQKMAIKLKHKNKQILLTSTINTPLSVHVSLIINTHTSHLQLPFTTRLPLELLITITCMRLYKLKC